MLDHDGVFTLHLEEGWKVTSGPGPPTYELLHPDKPRSTCVQQSGVESRVVVYEAPVCGGSLVNLG